MNEAFGLLLLSGFFWVIFAVLVGMVHEPWRKPLLLWPLKVMRRAIGGLLIALGNAIRGKK